jgi:hypothetical protein
MNTVKSTITAAIVKEIINTHQFILALYAKLFNHFLIIRRVTGTESKAAIRTRIRLVKRNESKVFRKILIENPQVICKKHTIT